MLVVLSMCALWSNTRAAERWLTLCQIWRLLASDEGTWTIEAVHSLRHLDRKLGDGTLSASPITCILPMRTEVFTGDEDGRVVRVASPPNRSILTCISFSGKVALHERQTNALDYPK